MCQINKIYPRRKCNNQEVAVIILWKGERVKLCPECWAKIADSDLSWGEENGTTK